MNVPYRIFRCTHQRLWRRADANIQFIFLQYEFFFNIIYTPTDNSQTKHFHRKNSKSYYFLICNSISSFISLFNSNRKCAETKTNWNEKRVLCHKLIPFPLKFCGCHRIWIGKNKESTQLQALEALQTKGVAVADAKMEIISIRCDQLFWRE